MPIGKLAPLEPFSPEEFDARMHRFLVYAQGLINAWSARFPGLPVDQIDVLPGPVYYRVIKRRGVRQGHVADPKDWSIYAFVDRRNGDLYKPETYRSKAPKVRGNLFEPDNGFHAMNWHTTY